jgi:hypothetical protein
MLPSTLPTAPTPSHHASLGPQVAAEAHHAPSSATFLNTCDREPLIKDRAEYERLYNWSLRDPVSFWGQMAKDYYWVKKVSMWPCMRGKEGSCCRGVHISCVVYGPFAFMCATAPQSCA